MLTACFYKFKLLEGLISLMETQGWLQGKDKLSLSVKAFLFGHPVSTLGSYGIKSNRFFYPDFISVKTEVCTPKAYL